MGMKGMYEARLVRATGEVESGVFMNLITNEGIGAMLRAAMTDDGGLKWFLGLKGAGDPDALDRAASHAGWAELDGYDGPGRLPVSVGVQGMSATTSVVTFFFNAAMTVHGAFLHSSSQRGGTGGVLFSVGNFASPRVVYPGDRLELSYTFNAEGRVFVPAGSATL